MKIKIELSDEQKNAARFCIPKKSALVAYGTGTGKSIIQILIAFYHVKNNNTHKFLFVCTKSSLIEVKGDFLKRTDEKIKEIKTVKDLSDFIRSEDKFGIVQYNLISKFDLYETQRAFQYMGKIGVCFDEVHTLKNFKSGHTKFFKMFRNVFSYCYGFTATPITSSLTDLFGIIHLLNPKVFGSYSAFESNFLEVEMVERRVRRKDTDEIEVILVKEITKFKNLPELRKWIDSFVISYYPELPIIYDLRGTPLSNRKEYITAAKGLTTTKPKQHSARLVELQYVVNNDPNKIKLFTDTVNEYIDSGIVIFCAFHESVEIISTVLDTAGIPFEKITGKETTKNRINNRDWFGKDPKGKVLIITLAGSQSLNLQFTDHILFFDIPFGIGYFIQVLGRIVRRYSQFKKFYAHFVSVEDTVDEYKYELIKGYKEAFVTILENGVLPGGDESFNKQLVDKLKRSLLWKRR